jgi:hypothetical protein
MVLPILRRQNYQTKLPFSQATEVAKQLFIHYIDPVMAWKSVDDHEARDDINLNPRL